MFTELLEHMKYEIVTIISKVKVKPNEQAQPLEFTKNLQIVDVTYEHDSAEGMSAPQVDAESEDEGKSPEQPYHREQKKLGRNEPCYCGSGKKYKHCHGKLT